MTDLDSDQFSDTPTGQKSGTDPYEPSYQPGYQTPEQANNPLDTSLRPPDPSYDPIALAEWKKEQSHLEPTNPARR